jgi:hypothetical protein
LKDLISLLQKQLSFFKAAAAALLWPGILTHGFLNAFLFLFFGKDMTFMTSCVG